MHTHSMYMRVHRYIVDMRRKTYRWHQLYVRVELFAVDICYGLDQRRGPFDLPGGQQPAR